MKSSSIEKALDLFELLARSEECLSLGTLSVELGIPKSTAHRTLRILCRRGYVSKDKTTSGYALGMRVFALHNLPAHHRRLVSLMRPHLRRLVRKLELTVNIAVMDPVELSYWLHSETPTSSGFKVLTGERAPLHCTGLGKVLLAGLDKENRHSVLGRLALSPKTPRTITSRAELEREIEEITKRGYAIDDEENTVGVRCLAAPIHSAEGLVVAAVSISALAPVFSPEKIPDYATELLGLLSELSAIFGYQPPRTAVSSTDSARPATERVELYKGGAP